MAGVLMSGSTSNSISPITSAATELLTWVITSMQSFWQFIIGNPLLALLCAILVVSFAAGLFFRFVRSL